MPGCKRKEIIHSEYRGGLLQETMEPNQTNKGCCGRLMDMMRCKRHPQHDASSQATGPSETDMPMAGPSEADNQAFDLSETIDNQATDSSETAYIVLSVEGRLTPSASDNVSIDI
ncbi:hypothetical protein CAPTEDRAFT_196676 [Capitella teleta]|uniref:Uncharacterized protein n=1 Tax=Capitella teleta TaxID=283909 RepID=R7UWF2_CAPTE|nr:hypothetical protein CAPTEDRAFT_196676 [Capitella teleta]|eukprot:ELU10597.1 hypothetical protein CAPTEDRAFT_196676 [Capitella teleta]